MSEISELERRITSALDRIARDVDVLAARPVAAAEDGSEDVAETAGEGGDGAALQQQLEDERVVSAQLEERVKSLRAKLDGKDAEAELAMSDLKSALAEMDAAMQALKNTSAQLRSSNEALRQANAAGVADVEAINTALAVELDALKAERQVEAAEGGAILAAMEPLIARAEVTEEKEGV